MSLRIPHVPRFALTAGSLGSLGARAWLASALLHGSIAAAVVAHGRGPSAPAALQLVDIQTTSSVVVAAAPVPSPPPAPTSVPALPVAPPRPSRLTSAPVTRPARTVASPGTKGAPTASDPGGDVPALVAAPDDAPPTFVMALPVGSSPASQGGGAPSDEVVDERAVSTRAEVASGPLPVYPRAARAAGIETDVPVELVVNAAGEVVDARIVRPVGYGLDEATLDAIRRYRFKPAQREGRAVAVRMLWTMQYRLQ